MSPSLFFCLWRKFLRLVRIEALFLGQWSQTHSQFIMVQSPDENIMLYSIWHYHGISYPVVVHSTAVPTQTLSAYLMGAMPGMRIRHTKYYTGKCHPGSHFSDTAGLQAKMASIELWIQ